MFKLSSTSLENLNLKTGFGCEEAGAFVSFEGWVRNYSDGEKVTALEYEAHENLCNAEAKKIFEESQRQFSIIAAKCFHRIGRLEIGEMAVWVGVTAGHRDAAFQACRFIIDQIKSRLPIWKKEFYANGDSGWVNCQCA